MDIAELVVRATPEGIETASEQMGELDEQTEQTKDSMKETGESMGEIQQRFQGAMGAIVGGIAVSTGFLLSRVPVLQETIDALGAVFTSMGLRIDSLIRGPMTALNTILFDVSEFFAQADGAAGALADTLSVIIPTVGAAVAAFAAYKISALGIAGAVSALIGALKGAALAIGGVIAGVSALTVGIVAAIAAIGAFIVAYLTNWRNARDKTDAIVARIIEFVTTGFNTLKTRVIEAFDDIIGRAVDWGQSLISRFIRGIQNKLGDLRSTLSNIASGIASVIPGVGGSVDLSLGSGGGGGSGSGGLSNQDFIGSVGGSSPAVYLDGSRVDDNQGRFRKGSLTRRGR